MDKRITTTATTLLILLAFLQGCTTRQWYNAAQARQKLECQKQPLPAYEECIQRTGDSYDSYQKKRQGDEGELTPAAPPDSIP
jgi:hypothetical protein